MTLVACRLHSSSSQTAAVEEGAVVASPVATDETDGPVATQRRCGGPGRGVGGGDPEHRRAPGVLAGPRDGVVGQRLEAAPSPWNRSRTR